MKTSKHLIPTFTLALVIQFANAQRSSGTHIYLLVDKYIELKNYLANNDEVRAGFKGSELFAVLGRTPDKGLSHNQKKFLALHMDDMMEDARVISDAGEKIALQRKSFADLTQHLLAVLKYTRLNPSTLYVDYCQKGNGYWLSETGKSKNPYNSEELNDCSKVRETLPGAGNGVKAKE